MSIDIPVERNKQPKARPDENNYGFGRYFTDHMFMAEFSEKLGWSGARIVPYQSLSIDPGASVLHYGQALFEGMKAFRGVDGKVRLFRPEMNWQRLSQGAARLCMQAPNYELFIESLKKFVQVEESWVPKKEGTSLYLRPTLIGSEAFLGVRPAEAFLYYVLGSPAGNYYGEGSEAVKIWVEEKYSRAAPGGIGAVKAGGNYASSLLAATEAKKRGYSQVLWLDASQKKYIEEVGTMNVFFKIKDRVVTPKLSGTILPGVTRDSVVHLLKEMGVETEVRPVLLSEVVEAFDRGELGEVFGTGTAASISPVGSLGFTERVLTINDGRPGPLAKKLYQALLDIQYGRAKDAYSWTVEVKI